MRPRLAVVTAALTALTVTAPADAALTRKAASKKALAVLHPAKRSNGVVYATTAPLPKGTRITAPGPVGAKGAAAGIRLRRPAWLIWFDESHGAMWEHPSQVLVLDAKTGRRLLLAPTGYWPVVNRKPAAFLATAEAYEGAKYRIFSGTDAPPEAGARAAATNPAWPDPNRADRYTDVPGKNGPFKVTPENLKEDCLIVVADQSSSGTNVSAGNGQAMHGWARDVGMAHHDGGTTPESLAKRVADDVAAGCKDALIYISGHGQAPPGTNVTSVNQGKPAKTEALHGGPAAVITAGLFVKEGSGTSDALLDGDKITPADLGKILDDHPTIEFKIKIDACFAGRFRAPLVGRRNLRVLELSSASNEVSYHKFSGTPVLKGADGKIRPIEQDPADRPRDTSYFTNANLHGLYHWARAPEETQPGWTARPEPDFPEGLAAAFGSDKDIDIVRTAGLTHPVLYTGEPLTPAGPTPGSTPFKVTVKLSWRHIGPGQSELCVEVTTDPARPGAFADVNVSGPALTGNTSAKLELNGSGSARGRFPINDYGAYSGTAHVTAGDGGVADGNGSTTVTKEQGDCPPP